MGLRTYVWACGACVASALATPARACAAPTPPTITVADAKPLELKADRDLARIDVDVAQPGTSPVVPLAGARLDATFTLRGTSKLATCRIVPDAVFDLATGAAVHASLEVEVPDAGVYDGVVRLLAGDDRRVLQSIAVRLERTVAPTTVRVEPVAPIAVEAADSARVSFVLRETAGAPARLDLPSAAALVRLVRRASDGSEVQVSVASAKLHADPSVKAPSPEFRPNEWRRFEIDTGPVLDGPGRYEGLLRFSAPGSPLVEQSIVILVRRSWWACGGWVLLGGVVVMVFRRLVTEARPRALRRRQIQRALVRIKAAASGHATDADVQTIHDDLRLQASDLLDRAAEVDLAAWNARLATLDHKADALAAYASAKAAFGTTPTSAQTTALAELKAVLLEWTASAAQVTAKVEALHPMGKAGPGAAPRPTPPTPDPQAELDALASKIRRIDAAIDALVLVVSIPLGLSLLWLSNAVWGDAGDVLKAVLWGLGLQNFGYTGLSGLRTKLEG